MTQAQEKKIALIKSEAERQLFYNKEEYEFKQFDVQDFDSFVSVVLEVGRIGDEGTLAAVFGRNRVHLFVGKRGGVSFINKKGKRVELPRLNLHHVIVESF